VITWASTYYIQGHEIRVRFSKQDLDLEALPQDPVVITPARRRGILSAKYIYAGVSVLVGIKDVLFLYSATKGMVETLKTGEDVPLATLSTLDLAIAGFYFTAFKLPFILTVDVMKTWKEFKKDRLGITDGSDQDELMLQLQKLIHPLACSAHFRRFVRISGSVADTFEHLLSVPLFAAVPLRNYLNELSPSIAYPLGTGICLLYGGLAGIILTQTYLFEGAISDNNLKSIALNTDAIEEEKPWIDPTAAKVFHYLLYSGAPLHGIDSGLSIFLTLKENDVNEYAAGAAAILPILIAGTANYFSEVKESQANLERMTKKPDEAAQLAAYDGPRFFKRYANKVTVINEETNTEETVNVPAFFRAYQTFDRM
jgi:hypothetical protein